MFPCTVKTLSELCGVAAPSDEVASANIRGVTIDSRSIQPGDVFFAMPGSRVHGVQFADQALAAGAVCVVSDQPLSDQPLLDHATTITGRSRLLIVHDVQETLQRLSAWNRSQSTALTIGVTGSVGKTTARQMIAAVLSPHFNGLQSPRNYNNEIGLPLTLCELNLAHEFAVLELGAGKPGDISFLCKLAQPEIAVITKVAPCHLESFGTVDNIRRTKQELVESVDQNGTILLNADDPLVRSMQTVAKGQVVLFGTSIDADVRAGDVLFVDGSTQFSSHGYRFRFEGPPQLLTCGLAAIAVGRTLGLSDRQIAEALSQFRPDAGRGRIRMTSPWTLIDETYNASPASVLATIESLKAWKGRRRILVLGDMMELGPDAAKLHREVAESLVHSGIHHTLFCGEFAATFASAALTAGLPLNRISAFNDKSTLIPMLECLISPGDVICIKGSRSTRMEIVVESLLSRALDAPRSAA